MLCEISFSIMVSNSPHFQTLARPYCNVRRETFSPGIGRHWVSLNQWKRVSLMKFSFLILNIRNVCYLNTNNKPWTIQRRVLHKYCLCCFVIKFTCKTVLRNPARLLLSSDVAFFLKKKQALIVKFVFWINKFESKSRYMYCTEVSYFSHSNSLFPLQAKSRERVRDLMQFLVCAVQTSDIITSSAQPLL